jgi:hypothetical protein
MRKKARWLLAAAGMVMARLLWAQVPPLGDEFRVNTYTTSSDTTPAIASRGDGSFVVVWTSYKQDGSGFGIFGQRFDEVGAKLSSEFPVNSYTTGEQSEPVLAVGPDGDSVIAWTSYGQDGYGFGVFGQRFDGAGAKLGPELPVTLATVGAQRHQSVAVDPSGDFVIVWSSEGQDGSSYGIIGQRFDASGAKIGGEFQVNTFTTGTQNLPQIAADRAGNFVVVWTSAGQDGSQGGIFGQRFDASGARRGAEFRVNTYVTGYQDMPSVAADRVGNFVVVWESAQDGSNYGIFGQRFNASAEKLGGEFQVNTYTTGYQGVPSVAVDQAGGFVVVWSSDGQDGEGKGVFGRRFDRLGGLGPEFQVNVHTQQTQTFPRIADDGLGFVATWQSFFQEGTGYGVYGRRQAFRPGPMKVDAHSGGGTISNQNGVLEPGETVLVEPAWQDVGTLTLSGSLTATGSNPSGPAGGIYLLPHGSADYGAVAVGFTVNCYDGSASHDCFTFSLAGPRPSTHWDAGFEERLSSAGGLFRRLHIGDSFSDVPRSQPFYGKIETVLHAGITAGCGGSKYCPGDAVSRSQMAIFVAKAIAGSGENVPTTGALFGSLYNCSAGGNSLFLDVVPTDSFCRHVHYIAAQGVTLGCNTATYCPGQTITRDAMASFIAKAIVAPKGGAGVPVAYTDPDSGLSYSCDAGTPSTHFADVPASNAFCKHIHYLWAKGIVGGCAATQYCPGQPVTRDAMAKFIANGFGLQLYGP